MALGSKGGLQRAQSLTAARRSEIAAQGGQLGGQARAASLTKAQRSEIARKAAEARWTKVQLEKASP